MTTLADPETRFPGLDDGMAYAVAAVVDARTAGLWVLVEHVRSGGCPDPARPDVLAEVVASVEGAAREAGWAVGLRDAVVSACADVDDLVSRIRQATR